MGPKSTLLASNVVKICLIHPPQSTYFTPYLALPTLAAWLRQAGHQVIQWDANLEANLFLLDEGLKASPEIRSATLEGLRALHAPHTYLDNEAILGAFGQLDQGYARLSQGIAPAEISHTFSLPHDLNQLEGVLAAVADDKSCPFTEYYAQKLLPKLGWVFPDVVGIGVAYESQIVPSLRLCAQIKALLPKTKIVLGGNVLGRWCPKLAAMQAPLPHVDAIISGEGEWALLELLEMWRLGQPRRLKNTLYQAEGELRYEHLPVSESLAELPPPDYSDLPLDSYLLPIRLLPLLTSRGCYWSRCAFCTHSHGYGAFRMRPKAELLNDLQTLAERDRAAAFFLADECVPPKQIRVLAEFAREHGEAIPWYGDVRLEKQFADSSFVEEVLVPSGCRMLIYGLEAATQEVLDRIDKGGSPERYARVLEATHQAGIANLLMFFSGFPGESMPQAHATLRFVQAHAELIDGWGNGAFSLNEGSRVHAKPRDYGVTILDRLGELSDTFNYRVSKGLTPAAASQIAAAIGRSRQADAKFGLALPREIKMAQLVIERSTRVAQERAGVILTDKD